ncbi:hypothetical protein [Methylobacterium sp. ARG-1]|uniref:DUF6894 family protein n=1 Tax=Methylobacterium sp. ARG-1 TaxID=1692501 RepID=UPI000682DFE4|nr:hypothetical protein [Methylobacterium sp. ARG-1]KNY21612.1 hypothetical protein AKJ13_15275 [Methylobacterium sp. ARG-1]
MPRYFFDTFDGVFVSDEEGFDLPDTKAAAEEATASLPDLARSLINRSGSGAVSVTVRDEYGRRIFCTGMAIEQQWL